METKSELVGKKILAVDDEPDMLVFISAVLEDNGATVIKAYNADEAIELARREKPDLITLDISMPGKDGGYVFAAICNDPELRATPVCIISGKPELRRLIYDRAVPPPEGFLDKPLSEETLLLNIRKILKLSRTAKKSDQNPTGS